VTGFCGLSEMREGVVVGHARRVAAMARRIAKQIVLVIQEQRVVFIATLPPARRIYFPRLGIHNLQRNRDNSMHAYTGMKSTRPWYHFASWLSLKDSFRAGVDATF